MGEIDISKIQDRYLSPNDWLALKSGFLTIRIISYLLGVTYSTAGLKISGSGIKPVGSAKAVPGPGALMYPKDIMQRLKPGTASTVMIY